VRGGRILVRAFLYVAIVGGGASAAFLPAHADGAVAPGVPTRVVASDATGSSLDVSWSAPVSDGGAAISDYTIQYREVGQLSWSTYAHTASTATTATVTGLSAMSTYVFRVAAKNTAGTGGWNGQESTIDAGAYDSCAVMANGSARCWGKNDVGQLGNNSTTNSSVPVPVWGITGLSPETTAVSVSTGGSHSCAVMADGTVQCWGANFSGQLGNNSTTSSSSPVLVSGISGLTPETTAVSVSTGAYNSCAVMGNGAAECWGNNMGGQLGNNSSTDSLVPVPVQDITGLTPETTAVSVSTSLYHSCAVMANGSVTCWGNNGSGQLGNNSAISSPIPVLAQNITGLIPASTAVIVSTGSFHTCALMGDSTVQCWGANSYGQLGTSSTTSSLIPVLVSGISGLTPEATAINVSTGDSHTCVVMVNGSAQCWGYNSNGQLGNNSTTNSLAPGPVSGITGFASATTAVNVSAGFEHSCAVMADGTATCWGRQRYGELGNNSINTSTVPVHVSNIDGSSNETRVANGTTTGRTLLAAPGTPGRPVIGTRSTTSIAISWAAAAANGSAITSYIVEYSTNTGEWKTISRADPTTLAETVTGLTTGGSYRFRVSAVSDGGTGAPSVVSLAALAARAPGAPGSVSAKSTKVAGQIKVTWKKAALNGAPSASYKVSWLVAGKWTTPVTATGSTYTITKLRPGTYSVKVIATTVEGSTSAIKAGIKLLQ